MLNDINLKNDLTSEKCMHAKHFKKLIAAGLTIPLMACSAANVRVQGVDIKNPEKPAMDASSGLIATDASTAEPTWCAKNPKSCLMLKVAGGLAIAGGIAYAIHDVRNGSSDNRDSPASEDTYSDVADAG